MNASAVAGPSYQAAVARFDQIDVAANYPSQYKSTARDRRELACIVKALANVPKGSTVLDLPCGTGRLTAALVEQGFNVVGADSSPNMVHHAQENWSKQDHEQSVTFQVGDVMNSGFEDNQFDAILSNRLFHHFYEPATRRAAFRELNRICSGPIVVSFFNSFALDALKFKFRNALKGHKPTDRVPIPMQDFLADADAAGLKLQRSVATRWGVSPQWYVVLESK